MQGILRFVSVITYKHTYMRTPESGANLATTFDERFPGSKVLMF